MSDHAYAVGPGSHPAVNLPLPNSAEMLPPGLQGDIAEVQGPLAVLLASRASGLLWASSSKLRAF